MHLPHGVQAAAGNLDLTFGSSGKITTDFFNDSDAATDIAVQPDGKIIAVGDAFNDSTSFDFAISRYNSDGSFDTGFGSGGKLTTDFFGEGDFATAIAIQTDGKIIASGFAQNNKTGFDFALTRYNVDGSLDFTFGAGGKVTTDFGSSLDTAFALAIVSGGKIVVAGTTIVGATLNDFALAQYNSDGTLDSGFGLSGKITADFFGGNEVAHAIAIQSDGKIVASGSSQVAAGVPTDFGLVRFNTDGSLDMTFGVNGKVMTSFSGEIEEANAVVIQSDGKIVTTGRAWSINGQGDFGLVRYNGDGSLDSGFGSDGKVITDFSGGNDAAQGIVIQTDGKIVVAGSAFGGGTQGDFALARYNVDGSLDFTFGVGGKVTTDFGFEDGANAIAIQADGRIIAAGFAPDISTSYNFALVRYDGDGPFFNMCLQDDSNGNILQINTATGNYQFTNCSGFTVGGTGTLTRKGCTITLQHNNGDRRVLAKIDTCQKKATASIRLLSQGTTFTITDRNTANNNCACGN